MMAPKDTYSAYFKNKEENSEETYLYDPALLTRLTFAKSCQKFRPNIPGPMHPGEGLKVKPLSSGDFDRGKKYCF